jgi:error-prone DNA polymerase
MTFTHLHVSSAYSAHYGVSWPRELAATARSQGAWALACADRDGLYGAVKHMDACLSEGLAPILGADLAVAGGGRALFLTRTRRPAFLPAAGAGGTGEGTYAALCRLVSHAHSRGLKHPPEADRSRLSTWIRGESGEAQLTVLLGPASSVGWLLQQRRYGAARAELRAWIAAVGADALVGELVTHYAQPGNPLSTAHAVRMHRLCQEEGVPTILSNAVRYASPDGAVTADLVDAARHLSPLGDIPDPQPTGQGWLKNTRDMQQAACEIMRAAGEGTQGAAGLLRRTEELAAASVINPRVHAGWKQPRVPEPSLLGITQQPLRELHERCHAQALSLSGGVDLRGQRITEERVRTLLDHELGIIGDLGFETYFLTVAEVTRMIRDAGLRVSARGSGASSMVTCALGISAVNPLQHDLIFERFLSRDRTTLPDIDIDVESAQRHRIYRDIFASFGEERVSLMSMQNAYQARGAVRDAGLALGLEEETVGDIASSIWRYSASSLRDALASKPELRDTAQRIQENRQLDLLVDLSARLDRLPRHISMHPCGVLLSDTTLLNRTPVQTSGIGLPMSQYDKHDMDLMGFIKLDVLGVRMQSAIAYTLDEIQRIHGDRDTVLQAGAHPADAPYIDDTGRIAIDTVPLNDPDTFTLIRSTHTLGCFQIESPGQRELIGKLEPREFNDLIIDISLFRPGPMQSNMVKPYLENRHGFAPENYPHPRLKEALRETHGVTVFHEQVLRIFDEMTGCGLAQADVYRRLLGKPGGEAEVETRFRERARERGFTPDVINSVWGILHGFGSFGFCKAHGAAFAMPTYQSAWLKAHHPEAFLAGIWEHDPGMYPKRLLVAEARRMGIPILPLDVNASDTSYRVERLPDGRLGIRLALAEIRGVSRAELSRLAANAPYTSISEVRDRARLSRRSMVTLAAVGAFESLSRTGTRANVVAHLHSLADRAPASSAAIRARARVLEGQMAFDLGDLEQNILPAGHPEQTPPERIRTELTLLGLDVSDHLMSTYDPLTRHLGTVKAKDLLRLRSGTDVLVAGVRVATQTPPMRGGKRVVFISVDDGTGCVDATFFSDAQEQAGPLLFGTRQLLIRGRTRRTGARGMSLQATGAWDLTQAWEAFAAHDGSLEALIR